MLYNSNIVYRFAQYVDKVPNETLFISQRKPLI